MPSQATDSFIPVSAPWIGEREIAYVTDAVRSGWVSSIGPYVDRFEASLAAQTGVKHAIAVSNGTAALHLALHALGIGPGDEVIVPDLTFVATAHAVLMTGAEPVFVDSQEDSWCMDQEAVRRAVGPRTRAIIAVHLYGHPAAMGALSAIAAESGLIVVEDAAEAHGAKVGGVPVGSLGTVGAFSFYGNKIITTGEGGALTTNDDALMARLRFLKDHGMTPGRRYHHTELAFNYRMTNLQAALGLAQIERMDELLARKRSIAGWYEEELGDVPGLRLNAELPGYSNVYWMPSVVLDASIGIARDEFCGRLKSRGIDSRPFFEAMGTLPHLKRFRSVRADGGPPVASRYLARRGVNLPGGCGLDRATVARVGAAVRDVLQGC